MDASDNIAVTALIDGSHRREGPVEIYRLCGQDKTRLFFCLWPASATSKQRTSAESICNTTTTVIVSFIAQNMKTVWTL